jgi:hypothetical protein
VKKFLPYILTLVIIANVLAPISTAVQNGNLLKIQRAEAAGPWHYTNKSTGDIVGGFADEPTCDKADVAANGTSPSGCSDAVVAQNTTPEAPKVEPGTGDVEGQLPACGIGFSGGTLGGCIAQIFYYVLFVPTSWLFGFAGKFFDFTFAYSISDTSYRTAFVTEGWGIVRDICNVFFIFVLLYVAFATVLGIHGFNTKKMIINVVIIGLLINFSLFATQVIIDASNILARVFYQSTNVETEDSGSYTRGGANVVNNSDIGEKALSAALVAKVDPQRIIIKGVNVNVSGSGGGTANKLDKDSQLGAGAFILITLMATAVNVVGIISFLTVGMVFIGRVIGLWFAMVLVPFAFFSYTVPQMQGIKMLGWRNWWPDTLKMAFLAPLFMFFMYLILKFTEKGLGVFSANDNLDGVQFVIAVMIPFVFIMVMLMKAKSLAQEFSGSIGNAVVGGVTAAAGLALGGAALGTAALGRNTIGAFMKGSATGETSVQRFVRGDSKGWWDRMKGGALHYGTFGLANRAQVSMGRVINHDKHDVHEIDEGRHLLNETSGQMYHGQKYDQLGVDERQAVRNRMDLNDMIRNRAPVQYTDPNTGQQVAINYGNRKNWSEMTNAERAGLEAQFNANQAATTRQQRRQNNTETFAEQQETNARRKQGIGSSLLQSSVTGSYDARNLSKMVGKEFQSGITKMGIGLISSVALGIRAGLKSGMNVNHGVGQGSFFKDLGHTITEAMKSAKISVKVDAGHSDSGGHEDHGGGGGHH